MGLDGTNEGRKRIEQLARNTRYFRKRLAQIGVITYGHEDSPVVPMLVYLFSKIGYVSSETVYSTLPNTFSFIHSQCCGSHADIAQHCRSRCWVSSYTYYGGAYPVLPLCSPYQRSAGLRPACDRRDWWNAWAQVLAQTSRNDTDRVLIFHTCIANWIVSSK